MALTPVDFRETGRSFSKISVIQEVLADKSNEKEEEMEIYREQ